MEVECPRHPVASTIGSQFLDETAPMAGKSRQPNHESPHRREEGHPSHWYSIYSGKKGKGGGGGGGNNPEIMLKCRMVLWQIREIHTHVDNRRPLTAQAYQCWLHTCTGSCAWTNNAKCKRAQTPATCIGTSQCSTLAVVHYSWTSAKCFWTSRNLEPLVTGPVTTRCN